MQGTIYYVLTIYCLFFVYCAFFLNTFCILLFPNYYYIFIIFNICVLSLSFCLSTVEASVTKTNSLYVQNIGYLNKFF